MPRYLTLLQFTDKGAAALGKTVVRAHNFDKAAAKAGVKVEAQYWTLGQFDGMLVTSCEDRNAILELLSQLMAQGNVRCNTMEAFTDVEFNPVVS